MRILENVPNRGLIPHCGWHHRDGEGCKRALARRKELALGKPSVLRRPRRLPPQILRNFSHSGTCGLPQGSSRGPQTNNILNEGPGLGHKPSQMARKRDSLASLSTANDSSMSEWLLCEIEPDPTLQHCGPGNNMNACSWFTTLCCFIAAAPRQLRNITINM